MISVVVPIFNEKDNVQKLHREIFDVLKKLGRPFEIIFINDGSSDGTDGVLKQLSPLTVITFRKNFGQTAALDAGFKQAKGTYIIALDGDGQDDPTDIPLLIQHLEDTKLDVVSGWRKNRQDNKSKRLSSFLAAIVRRFLINDGIHDSGCTFKIYRKECFEEVDLYGEMHRFIPAVLKIKGFTVGEIVVNHRPRLAGITKYNWKRGVKGILDMVSVWFWKKFANRPLHLFGTTGVVIGLFAFIFFITAVLQKFISDIDLSGNPFFLISLFGVVMGMQFVVFGLLADILSKNYYASRKETAYVIKEVTQK